MLRFVTAGFFYILLTPMVKASTPHYSVNTLFNQSAPTMVVTPDEHDVLQRQNPINILQLIVYNKVIPSVLMTYKYHLAVENAKHVSKYKHFQIKYIN